MTRAEFRGAVEAPRPAAAWAMSIIASATLWITAHLPFWLIAVQLIAYAFSYATRLRPTAFSRSPIWLNIGMIGITTVTIRAALAGNPATISLALFAALSQGLQLLDARPRRSEFVLVALALFQVILASTLTDSVFFPPLIVLFLVAVTWTLMIHTVQMEAAEAGDPTEATTAIRGDLRRTTALATAGCLALALVLFMALPRVKTHMLRGGMAGGMALSGFSDRVQLGDIGRIRKDPSVVLRVEAVEGELPLPADAYWKGLAFDGFDGRNWSISETERLASRRSVPGVGRFGIRLRPESPGPKVVQSIIREPVRSGVLFASGDVERIEGPFQHLERDPNGGIYLPALAEDRIRYRVWTLSEERDARVLALDRVTHPLEAARGGQRASTRYATLPELDPRIAALASEILEGANNDLERSLRLQEWLRMNGQYTDSPPDLSDAIHTPIESFLLGGLEGHCEYFASAMVVLARTQGIPARLVNGFAGGVENSLGGFIEVTQADAHAWVEIHFEQAGWVRFDPTPPDLRMRAAEAASLWTRLSQVGGAIELWWFQRVVDFDSADQIGAVRGLFEAWKGRTRSTHNDTSQQAADSPQEWDFDRFVDALPFAGGFVLIGLLYAALRERAAIDQRIPAAYRDSLRLLDRRGWTRAPTDSARDFAEKLRRALPAEAAQAFDRITEDYLARRFGEASSEGKALEREVEILKSAVDRVRLGNQPNIA